MGGGAGGCEVGGPGAGRILEKCHAELALIVSIRLISARSSQSQSTPVGRYTIQYDMFVPLLLETCSLLSEFDSLVRAK